MKRFSLLVTATAVPMIAACGAPAGVPEWKAAPSAAGSMPAPSMAGSMPAPSVPGGMPAPSAPRSMPAPTATAAPPTDIATAATSMPGAPAPADRFIAAVRGRLPEVAIDRRPEEITEIGDAACASLAAGQRRAAAAGEITGYGVSSADARELVTLARDFLCGA